MFRREEFLRFIIENDIVGFFEEPVKLKSGRLSPYYVNWRNAANDVYLIDRLTDFIIEFVRERGLRPDCFYGVPEGATKTAIITQYKWARAQVDYGPGRYVLAMGRGKPKEHGEPKDRFFIGMPRGKTVVLEDVVTTGSSLIENVKKLREAGVDIEAVVVLTDRNERRDDGRSVAEVFQEMGIPFMPMSNAVEIIPMVASVRRIGEDIKRKVEEYFRRYGTRELKLGVSLWK